MHTSLGTFQIKQNCTEGHRSNTDAKEDLDLYVLVVQSDEKEAPLIVDAADKLRHLFLRD